MQKVGTDRGNVLIDFGPDSVGRLRVYPVRKVGRTYEAKLPGAIGDQVPQELKWKNTGARNFSELAQVIG